MGTGFNHNKINALILSSQLNFRRNVLNKNGDGLHFTSVQICSLAGKVSLLIFHYAPIMCFILSISFIHMTEMFLSIKTCELFAKEHLCQAHKFLCKQVDDVYWVMVDHHRRHYSVKIIKSEIRMCARKNTLHAILEVHFCFNTATEQQISL